MRWFVFIVGMLSLSCQSSLVQRTFDCTTSNGQPIRTEHGAVDAATKYLNRIGIRDFTPAFGTIMVSDSLQYLVLFKRKEDSKTEMVTVRKSDGCCKYELKE